MFEQILITEYRENSLGLPLAVPQKNDLDNISFLSNPRIGHLHDSVFIFYYYQNPLCHFNLAGITKFKYDRKTK